MQHCPLTGATNVDINKPYPNPCINPYGLDLNTTQIIFGLIFASVRLTGVADDRINAEGFPTFAGCKSVSNTGPSQPSWYAGAVIWQRLTNWKLPLLQLFFLTALPAVANWYRALVLSRLLGNPISTVQNLLLKLSDCNHRARTWQTYFRESESLGNVPRMLTHCRGHIEWRDFLRQEATPNTEWELCWKSISMIVISYQEFGMELGDHVSQQIYQILRAESLGGGANTEFLELCRHTAEALAADRYTTFVPIIAAQIFFILAIATPFIQIRGSPPITPGLFLNIEAYSIAFSLLFFWMIFTTFLSAIIGVSQSRDRISRILNRFRSDLRRLHHDLDRETNLLQGELQLLNSVQAQSGARVVHSFRARRIEALKAQMSMLNQSKTGMSQLLATELYLPNLEFRSIVSARNLPGQPVHNESHQDTIYSGRIPSWQPGRWDHRLSYQDAASQPALSFRACSSVFSILMVTFSCSMGFLLAWWVPPHGFECRHIGLISMWFLWMLSYILSTGPVMRFIGCITCTSLTAHPFWYCYVKDTIVALLQSGAIIVTQCGILNSCACYTLWGRVHMPLSSIPSVAHELHKNFRSTYAYITFFTIFGFYIFFPAVVLIFYRDAARVFLQRDDGRPHNDFLQSCRWHFYKLCVKHQSGKLLGWFYRRLYHPRDDSRPQLLDLNTITTASRT